MEAWRYPPAAGFRVRTVLATATQPARVSVDRRQIVLFVSEDLLHTTAADAWVCEVDSRQYSLIHIPRVGLRLNLATSMFGLIGKRTEFMIRPFAGTAHYTIMEAD